jgi:hypothetical protein
MQYWLIIARGAGVEEAAEAKVFCAEPGLADERTPDIASAKPAMTTSSHNLCLKKCIFSISREAFRSRPKAFVAGIFPQGLRPSKGLPTDAEFCHI